MSLVYTEVHKGLLKVFILEGNVGRKRARRKLRIFSPDNEDIGCSTYY